MNKLKTIITFTLAFVLCFSINIHLMADETTDQTDTVLESEETSSEESIISTYDIVFDGNGATSGTMSDVLGVSYNEKFTLDKNEFKKTGSLFVGWNTKSDGTGTLFEDCDTVCGLTEKDKDTVVLYAIWEEQTYTITYYLDGGTNAVSNPGTFTSTDEIILSEPSKTGYLFDGWYEDCEFITKSSKIEKGCESNKEFYAKWNPISYTIQFDGNNATGGSMSSITCEYDSPCMLSGNSFKKTGYNFNGWNTKADGSGTYYADGTSVENLVAKNGASVVLYAQWEKAKYSITYVLNGGKNSTSNPSNYTITSNTITFEAPTRTGYTFLGWYKDSSFTSKITKINSGSIGNRTIYAKWQAHKYSIRFYGNGSTSGKMSVLSGCKYGTSYKLTANAYAKKGYVFVSWNTKSNGTGTTYLNSSTIKNISSKDGAVINLYAQWAKKKYTISYKLNGGTNSKYNPTIYTDSSKTITLKSPTRTGYTFNGWYSDSSFKNRVKTIPKGSKGNKTLYAKWTPITYKIVFKANGGTGSMSAMTCTYGKTYTLSARTIKNNQGLTFTGWNTKADGTGKTYSNKAVVKNLRTTGGTVTLYAQWELLSDKDLLYGTISPKSEVKCGISFFWSENNCKITGTSTQSVVNIIYNKTDELPKGIEPGSTYYSKCYVNQKNIYYRLTWYLENGKQSINSYGFTTGCGEFTVPSNAKGLKISIVVSSGYTVDAIVTRPRIYMVQQKKMDKPLLISFVDDDTSNDELVEKYYLNCKHNGIVGNYACITSHLEDGVTSIDRLLEYEAEGFGVLTHAYKQSNSVAPEWYEQDVEKCRENVLTAKRQLQAWGFSNYNYWVTPSGIHYDWVKTIGRQLGFDAIISNGNNDYNTMNDFDSDFIKRISLAPTDTGNVLQTMERVKSDLLKAANEESAFVLVTTHFNEWKNLLWDDTLDENGYPIGYARFNEIVDYAESLGFEVVSFPEAWSYYETILNENEQRYNHY